MSETNQEPIYMEQAEYIEYLKNQQERNKAEGKSTPIAQISMYQINKDLVRGLKKMTNMEIDKALEAVKSWYIKSQHDDPSCYHYALLNHEKHYYTIFEYPMGVSPDRKPEDFIEAVKDILTHYYGDNDIRAIDVMQDDNNSVEIWAMWDGEPTVAYLFPYEQGVVYF